MADGLDAEELRICLVEMVACHVALTEAAAQVGLDMRVESRPIIEDAAKALGVASPVAGWPSTRD